MKYLIRFFLKHKGTYLIMMLLLVLSTIFLGIVLGMGHKTDIASDEQSDRSDEVSNILRLTETMSDVDFYSYMDDGGDIFSKIAAVIGRLDEKYEGDYVIQAQQPIALKNIQIDDKFLNNYETGGEEYSTYESDGVKYSEVKTIQVSGGFFSQNKLTLSSGNLFSEDDYSSYGLEEIPVILGSEYSQYYNIGDTFEGSYLYSDMKFKIIGFVSEDSFFYDNVKKGMISCGRYIFMPVFMNLSYDDVGMMALDQYIQSYIYTHGQYEKVREDVENIIEECGLSDQYIGFMSEESSEDEVDIFSKYASMTGLVSKYLTIIITIMIVCITAILSIVLVNLIQEENFNFGVYIMCGMKPGKLALILFLFDMSVVGISDIVTVWILLMKNTGALSILIVQAVMLAILAVSYIVCYVNLKRVDISSLLGGNE